MSGYKPRTLTGIETSSLILIRYSPDLVPTVIRNEQRSIPELQESDGSSPDFTFPRVQKEASQKISWALYGPAVLEGYEIDGVADPLGTIP